MGLLSFRQRIDFVDPEFQIVSNSHLQNIGGTLFQFLARSNIVVKSRTRKKELALLRKLD